MHITIFHTENGSTEIEPRKRNMTAEESKSDWTYYANDIDEALLTIASRNGGWFGGRQHLGL